MWNFKSTFMIVLFCCSVSQNLAKAIDDDDTTQSCSDADIDITTRYLQYSKEVYAVVQKPSMKMYEEMLRDVRKYYHSLIENCPESNYTYYGEYLARHAEMEECVEGFIQHDDDKELKCLLLKDQGNVDFMVHKVVSNSPEGFDALMTFCVTTPADLSLQILIYDALAHESSLGADNYKKLFFRVKRYVDEVALNAEEHSAFCEVLSNILWSSYRSNPSTAFDEIITDIYNANSTFGEKIVHDSVVEAIRLQQDFIYILGLLGRVPSPSTKIRGFVYICGHLDGYPNIHEAQLQLAYTMKTIMEDESYKETDEGDLLFSLAEAYEGLPSFATQFLASGKLCLLIAGEENKEQENIFLVDGNQHLFTPKEDGMTTSCDFDKEGKLMFYKEAPPKDVTGEIKCELGDFHPTGEHGVNCSLMLHKMNVFVCDDAKYIVDGPTKFLELRRIGGEQMTSSLEKWKNNCVAHE